MSEEAGTPDPAVPDPTVPGPAAPDPAAPCPAAAGGGGGPSGPGLWPDEGRPGLWPGEGRPCLSEDDLLALLDGLGVAGTHDPEEDQEAIAEAEWAARQVAESGPDGVAGEADESAVSEGLAVSPVLIGEHLPAGPGLAAFLADDPAGQATDWDLPGLAAGYRRIAAWAQARELDAAAEIAARRAAANPHIGTTGEEGRPASLPPEAAAEIALELRMSQPGASAWTALGCRLRWDLPGTGTALGAGTIDLPRARIIADATTWLTPEHAAAVEARVLPAAGGQTISQLRATVRRAVLAIDPEGAEQRRRDTERSAKIGLYPGEEGTASLTGSCLPGLQAAAAMARITAMARALKSSGAHGGLDLLRAHVFLGLLLGTLPLIPPPADGPPDTPPDPGNSDGSATGAPGEGGPGRSDGDGTPDEGAPGPSDEDGSERPDGDGTAGGPGPGPDHGTAHDGNRADHRGTPRQPQPADPGQGGAGSPAGTAPDHASPASQSGGATPGGSDPPDGEMRPPGEGNTGDLEDLPGWWPDIPPPGDADAPPLDGDPPDPVPAPAPASDPDDADDDWPQLPPPAWPPLPPQLPAPPGDGGGPTLPSVLARTGLLDVLIPWATLTGHSREPAILGRIGPVSSTQARELLALAVRNPATQWRVILTTDDGRALAVHHARPPRHPHAPDTGPGMTGVIGRITITIAASTLSTPAAQPRPGSPLTICHLTPAILAAAQRAAERARAERGAGPGAAAGGCDHHMASACYRPPPRLREHITARDRTCRFGPCGQPAWRTDLDHTTPWHHGGPTCPCNLGGCCRTHHQIKQLPGWHLHQPQPGTFTWTTPARRTYHVQPDPYPV
jgi:Domain of unknown function (DUF222)